MLKNQKGFSLVELMIVVAIIGILAAMAVPNFQKFQNKSKQAEAKDALSALYTAEIAYQGEYSTFSTDLDAIGWLPSGNANYGVGWSASIIKSAAPAPLGTGNCFETCSGPSKDLTGSCTNAKAGDWTCSAIAAAPAAGAMAATTFTASADATLAAADEWQITNAKALSNSKSGL